MTRVKDESKTGGSFTSIRFTVIFADVDNEPLSVTVTVSIYELLVSKFKLLSDLVKPVQQVTALVSEITPVEGLMVKRPAELPPVRE
jgi:hypothetical protein